MTQLVAIGTHIGDSSYRYLHRILSSRFVVMTHVRNPIDWRYTCIALPDWSRAICIPREVSTWWNWRARSISVIHLAMQAVVWADTVSSGRCGPLPRDRPRLWSDDEPTGALWISESLSISDICPRSRFDLLLARLNSELLLRWFRISIVYLLGPCRHKTAWFAYRGPIEAGVETYGPGWYATWVALGLSVLQLVKFGGKAPQVPGLRRFRRVHRMSASYSTHGTTDV